jgi:hypothetical protein
VNIQFQTSIPTNTTVNTGEFRDNRGGMLIVEIHPHCHFHIETTQAFFMKQVRLVNGDRDGESFKLLLASKE